MDRPLERLKIYNPVNPQEDFTDKWGTEPEYYEAFKKFIRHLHSEWQKLKREHGVLEENTIMKGLFGNEIVAKAHTTQSEQIEKYRKDSQLATSRATGILTSANVPGASPVKPNTFYGE